MEIKRYQYSIDYYQKSEKPEVREKVLEYGGKDITDLELIMALLGNGKKDIPVAKLSEKVLEVLYTNNPEEIKEALLKVKGMGPGKTALILSALEFGKRFYSNLQSKILSVKDVVPLLQIFGIRKQEHFICITLNGAHEVLNIKVISVGLLNRTVIHPREVFSVAIADNAAAIIVAHNHPSGSLEPSTGDWECTQRLLDSSKILGIPLLDHLIITKKGYFSFLENTDLFKS